MTLIKIRIATVDALPKCKNFENSSIILTASKFVSKSPSSKDNSYEENSLRRSPRIRDKTEKKSFYNEL